MKDIISTIIIFVSCLFVLITTNVWAEPNNSASNFPQLYGRMDLAISTKSCGDVLDLLSYLDECKLWSFGAGLGPTDKYFLQLRLLAAAKDFLMDSGGVYNSNKCSQANTKSTNIWIGIFQLSPSDTEGLIVLLENANPAKRWLALEKLTHVSNPPESLIKAVENRAISDDYVIIVRKPIRLKSSFPSSPGLYTSDFDAPIRRHAAKVMEVWGLRAPTNDITSACLQMLVHTYSERNNDADKQELMTAIKLLDKQSPVRSEIMSMNPHSLIERKILEQLKE